MDGVHVIWSMPRNGLAFKTKYEFMTAVLSALEWKKHNGNMIMISDNTQYFHDNGLDNIWNIRRLHDISVNPDIFWAAGKIYAMKQLKPPFCMIDLDFIIWEKLIFNGKLFAIHEEELGEAYPDYEDFFSKELFCRNVNPVNTAFTYINSSEFLQMYINKSTAFMESYTGERDCLRPMIFAEQRMFSMCADKLNININILSDTNSLFDSKKNGVYTHLWGYKGQLDKDKELRESFEKRVLNRIKSDFPQYLDIIRRVIDNDF